MHLFCTTMLLAMFLLAGCILAGCNHGTRSAATPTVDNSQIKTNTIEVNWFVDKDSQAVPQGYVNWEAERQQMGIKTDLIVLHHTGAPSGMTWKELSDIQYRTLYVPRYNSNNPDPLVKGWTPHSNHFHTVVGKKVEVFYNFHWLIRTDGTTERLLNDDEVGWHCGDWDKNMRSIAICFDGDFTSSKPSNAALKAAAKLIVDYQQKFKIDDVVGHKDTSSVECPGSWWPAGKTELLKLADVIK